MQTELRLNIIVQPAEEGGFVAYLEDFPNVCTQGETLEEIEVNLKDALSMLVNVGWKNQIVGYDADLKPLTQARLEKEVAAASKRVKAGKFITQAELEKQMENW